MPNVLSSITASPTSIASGGSTRITIAYEATQLGTVEFACSPPFTVSPALTSVAPDPDGRASLSLTIRRRDPHPALERCDVLATFFSSSLHFFVGVER
jgi:hypothetical protein